MSISSAEKLVKQTIKLIGKNYDVDYDELKISSKKVIKLARNYDAMLLGMMEELLDLGNVGSVEELSEFNIEVLKIYCRIKELDEDGSDKHIRLRVWENIEAEFELDSDEDEDNESVVDSDEDDEDDEEEQEQVIEVEVEPEPEPEPEPEIEVKKVKRKKEKKVELIE